MNQRSIFYRRLFTALGVFVVVYCITVLGYVVTSPDFRVRCLLADDSEGVPAGMQGVKIQATPEAVCDGVMLRSGDILVRVGEQPIRNFLDFVHALNWLRNAPIPPGGTLRAGSRPSVEQEFFSLPSLVEVKGVGRYVEVEFWRPGTKRSQVTWQLVQSLPWSEIVLSLVWFVLQLGILSVAALAYWHRPHDRSSRLFFAMCVTTLAAFVGGYHWWVIAGSFWLNSPFVICAVFVPAVTLHFFMVYPREENPAKSSSWWVLTGLYGLPALVSLSLLTLLGVAHWLHIREGGEASVGDVLLVINDEVYFYLAIASLYFLLTVAALVRSFLTTLNPIQRGQLRWMSWAGMFAIIPVSYTMYLAHFDHVSFALGRASIPMFLASFSFMLAYSVGMLRYKLMLLDQIVSKGMLFYVASCGVTLAFAITIALSGLFLSFLNISPSPQQILSVFAVALLTVILLLWFRDRVQQTVDRKFFRQKYQLDKALQRMNRAVENLMDRQELAERMLASCREVLHASHAALYLREHQRSQFHLLASVGARQGIPLQITIDEQLRELLEDGTALQRVRPAVQPGTSQSQDLLYSLNAELIHSLETDGEIAALVVLGPPTKATAYSAEDITFLDAMGQITSVALHCAKVHQDMTQLDAELQLKMEKIATQKRQITMLQAELANAQATPANPAPDGFRRGAIKGNSPAMTRVLDTVRKVAHSESTVLIRGESGTGKELLAQAIHDNSPRRSSPLIQVHCAALSPTLLESELFGHVAGAFTGADRSRVGRFELANTGTLFLDEIGDISLETQIKLLRVLQERRFELVGSSKTVDVDVRLIAATHQDLERLIDEGKFREDLYYRLNVISVALPPLRERREDIFELILHFLKRTANRLGRSTPQIEDEVVEVLERYPWPGNIRQLENVIERAVVLAEDGVISLRELPREVTDESDEVALQFDRGESSAIVMPAGLRDEHSDGMSTKGSRLSASQEREILKDALLKTGGNKAEAARLLGLPRSTYYSKLKKYAIDL